MFSLCYFLLVVKKLLSLFNCLGGGGTCILFMCFFHVNTHNSLYVFQCIIDTGKYVFLYIEPPGSQICGVLGAGLLSIAQPSIPLEKSALVNN